MSVHRLRRWPNIIPTMAQRLVFAGFIRIMTFISIGTISWIYIVFAGSTADPVPAGQEEGVWPAAAHRVCRPRSGGMRPREHLRDLLQGLPVQDGQQVPRLEQALVRVWPGAPQPALLLGQVWGEAPRGHLLPVHRGGVRGPHAHSEKPQPQADFLRENARPHLLPDGPHARGDEDMDWRDLHWGRGLPGVPLALVAEVGSSWIRHL